MADKRSKAGDGPAAASAAGAGVCLGAIAGAFGVRGEVRLKPFTAIPEDIAAYGLLHTEDRAQRFEIRITRAVKGGLAARLSGVATREEAEALKGVRLYVDRAALPEDALEEDEYYHADLIGMFVEDLSGAPLGVVAAVPDFGAGDMLEIKPPQGRSVYLPFTREAAPHVDLAGRRIVADPPAGLFEAEEDPASAGAEAAAERDGPDEDDGSEGGR